MRTLQKISFFGITAIFLFTVSGFCRLPMVMAETLPDDSLMAMEHAAMAAAPFVADMSEPTVTMDHDAATPKHVTTCSAGCGQPQPVALMKKVKGYGELPDMVFQAQMLQGTLQNDGDVRLAPPEHFFPSEAILTVAKKE